MTRKQKRMKAAVEYMKDYIGRYDKQYGYLDYDDGIFIDDLLYGVGVALDKDDYSWADGYSRFKGRLITHLGGVAK